MFPLTEQMVRDNLQMLTRVGPGLGHAYVKLELKHKWDNKDMTINNFPK